jgi:Tfp pilus assembly protein PilV
VSFNRKASQAGVSLIEAVVALGVMAFGILGIAGIQATLRTNSDIAKQRSEAVRIAQEVMEDLRGFEVLAVDADKAAFAGIVSQALADRSGSNATYTRGLGVSDSAVGRMKFVVATVGWTDRLGEAQQVVLRSTISGVTAEIAGALGAAPPGGVQRRPANRHTGVPRAATDQGDGTSRFTVPGGSGSYWIFNNNTGVITSICSAADVCVDANALLLSGFVRFSTGMTQPSPADAENPTSAIITGTGVWVDQTAPFSDPVTCATDASIAGALAYYCAVPVTEDTPNWSGRSKINGLDLASSSSDDDEDEYRVCRYTRDLAHTVVGEGSPVMTNADHPRDYVAVDSALTNQNFLVIRAGDDDDAFSCPNDDTSTPFVSGRTYRHQPG